MTIDEAQKVTLPFGKHKGKALDQVPLSYIDWLASIDSYGKIKEAVAVYIEQDWFKEQLEEEKKEEKR